MNLDPFRHVSLELALNSRVSTGGWKGIERDGKLGSEPLTNDQVELVFWCLAHTPNISKVAVEIECDGKKTYIVVASNGRLRPYFSLMEAGYSVLHIVLQAQALKLASNIVVLSQDQMTKIRETIGLMDTPIALVPIGLT